MQAFFVVFGFVWVFTFIYLAMVATVGFRLKALKLRGSARPTTPDFFDPAATFRLLGWLFSSGYRTLDDGLIRRLVPLIRVLFILLVPAILTMFAWGWALRR
jgi:hypothetical protein